MSCALFLHLLPFFLATAAYFHLWSPEFAGSTVSAGVKAAPVLLLAAVVLTWNGAHSVLGVAGALVFSAVGDFCLVWPEQMFIHGMGAFAVAHLLYSLTFLTSRYSSYSSSSWPRVFYPILFFLGGGFYVYLYPYLQKTPNPDMLVPGVGVYVLLITLMGTLAIRTRRLTTVLGSLVFMVSDMALAVQVFKVAAEVKHGNTIVMATYYLSQLLIAVGDIKAVENKDDFSKWKSS